MLAEALPGPGPSLPPPFDGLEPEAQALLADLPRVAVAPGDRFPCGREVLLLLAGEVEERRSGRLLGIIRAPATLFLGAPFGAGTAEAELRPLSAAVILRLGAERWAQLERASSELADRARAQLAARVAALEAERLSWVRGLDDAYSPEAPGARLPAGRFAFDSVGLTVFVVQGSPERLGRLLPPDVLPLPGVRDRYLVLLSEVLASRFCALPEAGPFAYREVMPLLPCRPRWAGPAMFAPEVYPDAYQAILLGREIFGFPKRHGRIWTDGRSVDLAVGGELRWRARWQGSVGLGPGAFASELLQAIAPALRTPPWLQGGLGALLGGLVQQPGGWLRDLRSLRLLVHKRIPAADEPGRLAIDQLVEVPVRLTSLCAHARLLAPAVSAPADDPIFHGQVVAGFSARMGFELDRGRIRTERPC